MKLNSTKLILNRIPVFFWKQSQNVTQIKKSIPHIPTDRLYLSWSFHLSDRPHLSDRFHLRVNNWHYSPTQRNQKSVLQTRRPTDCQKCHLSTTPVPSTSQAAGLLCLSCSSLSDRCLGPFRNLRSNIKRKACTTETLLQTSAIVDMTENSNTVSTLLQQDI